MIPLSFEDMMLLEISVLLDMKRLIPLSLFVIVLPETRSLDTQRNIPSLLFEDMMLSEITLPLDSSKLIPSLLFVIVLWLISLPWHSSTNMPLSDRNMPLPFIVKPLTFTLCAVIEITLPIPLPSTIVESVSSPTSDTLLSTSIFSQYVPLYTKTVSPSKACSNALDMF